MRTQLIACCLGDGREILLSGHARGFSRRRWLYDPARAKQFEGARTSFDRRYLAVHLRGPVGSRRSMRSSSCSCWPNLLMLPLGWIIIKAAKNGLRLPRAMLMPIVLLFRILALATVFRRRTGEDQVGASSTALPRPADILLWPVASWLVRTARKRAIGIT
jgi:hypothetical protein